MSPTRLPDLAAMIAIFTAVVDFPTPPFPDPMATVRWRSMSAVSVAIQPQYMDAPFLRQRGVVGWGHGCV